ncbi:hypothetical protein HAX54_031406 [Datura stramonium]|uniref:Uncharacterized protein n=1 Tax=Datura stramonium TaxID=4076 RepID=A0ABS8VB94_DATST|nr:hypothetical protein [Datura stramonium]
MDPQKDQGESDSFSTRHQEANKVLILQKGYCKEACMRSYRSPFVNMGLDPHLRWHMENQSLGSSRQRETKRFEVQAKLEISDGVRNERMQSCTSSGKSVNDKEMNWPISSVFAIFFELSAWVFFEIGDLGFEGEIGFLEKLVLVEREKIQRIKVGEDFDDGIILFGKWDYSLLMFINGTRLGPPEVFAPTGTFRLIMIYYHPKDLICRGLKKMIFQKSCDQQPQTSGSVNLLCTQVKDRT